MAANRGAGLFRGHSLGVFRVLKVKTHVVHAKGPVEIHWPNGFVITVTSGGIVGGPQEIKRSVGRPASQATLALRERIKADAAADKLGNSSHYLEFFRKQNPTTSPGSAYQIVRRELRVVGESRVRRGRPAAARRGKGGRPISPTRLQLRQKILADKQAGGVKDVKAYADWLIDHDEKVGLKEAKRVVRAELKAA